jgi:hypothetical protein
MKMTWMKTGLLVFALAALVACGESNTETTEETPMEMEESTEMSNEEMPVMEEAEVPAAEEAPATTSTQKESSSSVQDDSKGPQEVKNIQPAGSTAKKLQEQPAEEAAPAKTSERN